MHVPANIAEVLDLYSRHCPTFEGAVVATYDGLLLGVTESFAGDTAAAVAASIQTRLQQDLSMLMATHLSECLVWVDSGVWYVRRFGNGHLLMARAASETHAGALRMAGQIAARQLEGMF